MRLPDLRQAADAHTAASLLVQAGFAVLPVSQGDKSPGSLLRKDWPDQSARTPADVNRLWALYPDSAVAIHHGGSRPRTVAIDIDNVSLAPSDLLHALTETRAFVSSRDNDADRGHHLFRVPAGRDLSNSPAGLTDMGLDVKTGNAVTVAWGRHKLASEGGRYLTEGGDVAELPEWIACRLADRGITGQADDAEVAAFLDALPGGTCPEIANRVRDGVAELLAAKASHDRGGPGRHEPGLRIVKGLVRLGERRFPGVREALAEVESAFMAGREGNFDGRTDWPRSLSGAVGAVLADPSAASEHYSTAASDLIAAMQKGRQERERAAMSAAPIGTEPAENPLREFLLSEGDVLAMRRPECLIADTLDRGTVGVLSARFGAFKSFLCLDWLLSTAYGVAWHGRATTQGPVLYVVAEGAWGQGERIRAWKEAHGITETSANFHMLRIPVQLADAERVSLLCRLVSELGAVLVIVDTFGKSTRGIEENSNTQVHLAIESLERVRDATPDGAGVVLTAHHSEKNPNDLTGLRSSRGAGAIEDDVDTVYQLTKNDDGTVTASRTKRKDGPTEDVWVITSEPVGSSLSLSYSDTTAAAVADAKVPAQRVRYERNVERARGLLDEGRAVTVAQVAARCEVTKPPAQGYLDQLVEVGEASVTVDAHKVRWYSSAGGP